jgi:hypothetical protein
MKVMHGLDFVRDANNNPKEFFTVQSVINYAKRHMPKELKAIGFGVGVWVGDDYIRYSYGRKC